jgi:hypothetical protein
MKSLGLATLDLSGFGARFPAGGLFGKLSDHP